MNKAGDVVFIGMQGSVLALDRSTGAEIWRTGLKGKDFVNVVLDGDRVLAATRGELFCLDPATGRIFWTNELPGLGRGLITVATESSPSGSVIPNVDKRRRDEEAASSSAVVVTT
jgi:outer membrane protein assembly factor BamB